MLHPLLLFVHVAGVVVWVGGMTFAHFCLRPAAVETLPPPLRLALWRGVLRRFFLLVSISVALIVASGIVMFVRVGAASAPAGWHLMSASGTAMAAIYLFILLRLFPAFSSAVDAEAWSDAGAHLARIRTWVSTNLALGALTIASATLVAGWGV